MGGMKLKYIRDGLLMVELVISAVPSFFAAVFMLLWGAKYRKGRHVSLVTSLPAIAGGTGADSRMLRAGSPCSCS
jgi:hypothetical protein